MYEDEPFENLSDEDKRHAADGWLEREADNLPLDVDEDPRPPRRQAIRGDFIPPVSDYAHWNEDAEMMWYQENKYDMDHWDEPVDDPVDD